MKKNILIIEDDQDIREGIRILLEGEGFSVTEAKNGKEGLDRLDAETDLVILDIMMPGISGLKVCEEIRRTSYVPILFLTAKAKESDKLIGFLAGADDYLVKPFSYAELYVRIKALLRRHQIYDQKSENSDSEKNWLESSSLKICCTRNILYVNESEVSLTEIEYRILLLLMQKPDQIFSIQSLYESIWQEPFMNSCANTLMVHIRHLRTKLEANPQKPKIIQTVWGKGYRFGENLQ